MAEQVSQEEEALLGDDGAIDVNFRAIEIAYEGIGDVASDHADAVAPLDMFLDRSAKIREGEQAGAAHATII
jgi:hypothetical protein